MLEILNIDPYDLTFQRSMGSTMSYFFQPGLARQGKYAHGKCIVDDTAVGVGDLCGIEQFGAQGLVDDLSTVLNGLREKQISVGTRLDIATILEAEEAEGWKRIGVVVCGPGGLCDDVRHFVSRRGRAGQAVWELDVEAFSW